MGVATHAGADTQVMARAAGQRVTRCIAPAVVKSATAALLVCAGLAGNAYADSFDTIESLNQSQFKEFSENLSAATRYNSVSPPEFLGLLGFDVGLELSSTEVDSNLFDLASDDDFDGSELVIARAHVQKGFIFGLDVGASIGAIPQAGASVIGAEIRYALIQGGIATPAVGIKASYAQLLGVDDYSLRSGGLEVGISKGFLFLTPYASIGIVRTNADAGDLNGLSDETYNQNKFVVGATFNLGVALTLEVDRTGGFRTYSAKAGIRF